MRIIRYCLAGCGLQMVNSAEGGLDLLEIGTVELQPLGADHKCVGIVQCVVCVVCIADSIAHYPAGGFPGLYGPLSTLYSQPPTLAENAPVDLPISPYAQTKKAGELLCHTYHHLHGLDVIALRFFTVFGPR